MQFRIVLPILQTLLYFALVQAHVQDFGFCAFTACFHRPVAMQIAMMSNLPAMAAASPTFLFPWGSSVEASQAAAMAQVGCLVPVLWFWAGVGLDWIWRRGRYWTVPGLVLCGWQAAQAAHALFHGHELGSTPFLLWMPAAWAAVGAAWAICAALRRGKARGFTMELWPQLGRRDAT